MNWKRLLLGVGVLATLAGLLVYLEPRLAPATSTAVVVLLGVVALWRAYRVLKDRRHAAFAQARTADVEVRRSVPMPGADVDRRLSQVDRTRGRGVRPKRELVSDLERTAVAVLVDRTGKPSERAREVVERGTWTTDPIAAAFLGGGSYPLRTWVRRIVIPGDPFRRHAERTIDAIVQRYDAGVADEEPVADVSERQVADEAARQVAGGVPRQVTDEREAEEHGGGEP